MTWTLGQSDGATLATNGNTATVTVTGVCDVTLTATAADGTGVSASMDVEAYHGPSSVTVTGAEDMSGGGSQTLAASVLPQDADDRSVIWTVTEGAAFASVAANGRLTTSRVTALETVTVRATSVDATIYDEFEITLHPVADAIAVSKVEDGSATESVAYGQTLYLDKLEGAQLCLRPTIPTAGALQAFKPILIGNPNVINATQNANGDWVITPKACGASTIVFTADDVSGTRFQLTVSVDQCVRELTVVAPKTVARGRSVAVRVSDVLPATAYNKSVMWTVDCAATQASINPYYGWLYVPASSTATSVTVTATANDARHAAASATVTIMEPVTTLEIHNEQNENYTWKTVGYDLYASAPLKLHAVVNEGASDGMNWTNSASWVANMQVADDGTVELTPLRVGATVVTAVATDGTGKYAYFILQVYVAAKGLAITGASEIAVGRGAYLTVDFTPKDATNKQVKWTCDKPNIATVYFNGYVLANWNNAFVGETVTVTATSVENDSIIATHDIVIKAPATSVSITAPQKVIDFVPEPQNASDNKLQLTATVAPATASQKITWTSSNTYVATVDEDGLVTALHKGIAYIYATAADGTWCRSWFAVSVVTTVKDIAIEGTEEIAVGRGAQLTVSFTPADATNRQITWTCDKTNVATVYYNGYVATRWNAPVGEKFTITATSNENSQIVARRDITITPAATGVSIESETRLNRIDLGSATPTLQLRATVTPYNAELSGQEAMLQNASQKVAWTSSNGYVATVDTNGLVTAKHAGYATIYATAADGTWRSGWFAVNVVTAVRDIAIEGAQEVAVGRGVQLKAVFDPTNATNKNVTWQSSDSNVAAVYSNGYVVTRWNAPVGSTVTITATSAENNSIVGEHVITIKAPATSVSITAPQSFIDFVQNPTGDENKLQLTATVAPAAASQKVTWTSSNTYVATVDANGLVTALHKGIAYIYATAADGTWCRSWFAVSVVTAVQNIAITGASEIAVGRGMYLKASFTPTDATNKRVKWTCDKPNIATVYYNGYVVVSWNNAFVGETVTITATSAENDSIIGEHEITIKAPATSVSITAPQKFIDFVQNPTGDENKLQLTATVAPDTASQKITWTSSNTYVATVDANGLVTALHKGTAYIYAMAADGTWCRSWFAVSVVTAVQNIAITGASEVVAGRGAYLTASFTPTDATNKQVKWTGDRSNLATVYYNGYVAIPWNAPVGDTVTITATSVENNSIVATHAIVIKAPATSVSITAPQTFIDFVQNPTGTDNKLQLTATVAPTTASQKVTWMSSNNYVATVDANGLVTALHEGYVVIYAMATDGTWKSASLWLFIRK